MKKLFLVFAVTSLSLVACGEPLTPREREARDVERKIAAAKKETARLERLAQNLEASRPSSATIPLPPHEIISDTISQPVDTQPKKRSVDVRLSKRLERTELERLGQAIRLQSPHKDRLFINYYLPNQTPGSGAWGSTHFTPEIEVKIHGLTLEQANDPFPALPEGATLIAKYSGNEFVGEKAIIFESSNGTTHKIVKYKDGSSNTAELYSSQNGKLEARNSHGEYYIIKSGTVSVYDSSGLIDTYGNLE